MAKGDYSSKWGGSKNAYDKGQKDANDSFINKVIDVTSKISDAVIENKKKR